MVTKTDVCVLDADGLSLSFDDTLKRIQELRPVAVGMTVTTYTFDMVNRFIEPLKQEGLQVLLGGPQVTLDPEGTLQRCPQADWVCKGEAEMIINEAVQRLSKGESLQGLDGICWKGKDGKIHISDMTPQVPDLDLLPLPRLDGLPMSSYWCPDAKRLPMMTMMTARGCPHRCGFCSSPALFGRKVRAWSVDKVLDYIEDAVRRFGIREISFVDDVFTIDKKRLRQLCEGILERGLDVTWFCNSRADQITEELAEVAKRAGCHQMYLGFESGDQRVLDTIKKGTTVARLEKGAAALEHQGIDRSVGFVVGLPGEDDAAVELSIEMAKRVRPERLQFTRWTPLVGSPLYEGVQGDGFHSSVTGGSDAGDEVDQRVRRMYEECGRGSLAETPVRNTGSVSAQGGPVAQALGPEDIEIRVLRVPAGAFQDILDCSPGKEVSVAVVAMRTQSSMAGLSRTAQLEHEERSQAFLRAAKDVHIRLTARGHCCDFVDPRSGSPGHGHSPGALLPTDQRWEDYLGMEVRELGCCRVLYHKNFGACMVAAALFSNCPAKVLRSHMGHDLPLFSSPLTLEPGLKSELAVEPIS